MSFLEPGQPCRFSSGGWCWAHASLRCIERPDVGVPMYEPIIEVVHVDAIKLPLRLRIALWQHKRRRRKLRMRSPAHAMMLDLYDAEMERAMIFGDNPNPREVDSKDAHV